MKYEIAVAILAFVAGLGWGYGFGSRHTRKIYERIVASYKDAATSSWARLARAEHRIGRLRIRLASKYIIDSGLTEQRGPNGGT